jgi:UDP-GlcNAc:undecaprenyl-phosphate GlcNAc-1-phosphate transferase
MLIFVCITAALVSLVTTRFVIHAADHYGIYDHPGDSRRIHTRPIPRLGGLAVVPAVVLGLCGVALLRAPQWGANMERPGFFAALIFGAGLLFAVGLWDDLRGLSPLVKLGFQCVAAAVAFFLGVRVEVLSLGPIAEVPLGVLSLPVTILWMVGITNAFNLIDGMDGLATGIAVVALATTLAVALVLGNMEVAVVVVALLGALLGFLRYNFSPARIFLGDSGSLFVGFMVAVLSVHGSTKSATAVMTAAPLLLLALPILDTVLSVIRRWLRGKPIFGADEHHLHHRMLAIGLTHVRAVVALYVMAAGLAVIGVLLASGPQKTVAVTALAGAAASVALLLFAIKRLGYHEFVEAGAVVRSGMLRVRQSIRDQIHARDVAQVVARAESLLHVQAILQDNAPALGLLYATVCRESSPQGARAELPAESAARAWKLECPIAAAAGEADPLILRVWTDAPDDLRLLTADRTARVLAAAVRDWLSGGPVHPHPVPAPVPHVSARRASAPA